MRASQYIKMDTEYRVHKDRHRLPKVINKTEEAMSNKYYKATVLQ